MEFKDHWDVDTALKIVQNKTVDSKLWAEAVEWLLLYGPPEIVSILLEASGYATSQTFPELKPGYTHDGNPVYDAAGLARSLGIPEEEIVKLLKDEQRAYQLFELFTNGSNETVH